MTLSFIERNSSSKQNDRATTMPIKRFPIIKQFTLLKHLQLYNGENPHTKKHKFLQSNRLSFYVGDLSE